ncbi:MAG: type V CRISPR-associated protein Cas12k [Coleofasciculus sp. S288]|nr:type V CRISPR-associated protein Cas12k [Coleofasciculus sp. S288]
MSMFTIQCRLCANEETRRSFWKWMEKYTLLMNELLENIAQNPQFPEWQKKDNISRVEVREILKPLKESSRYEGLPGRFYTSAELISCGIYKSWLALNKRRKLQAIGKERWIKAVESEFELSATTEFNSDEIRSEAHRILEKETQELKKKERNPKELIAILLNRHEKTEHSLSRRAINHLLINNLQINEEELNLDKLSERLDKKKVEVRRLKEQLISQLPKGRDSTRQQYLQILDHISVSVLPELSDDPQKLEAELDKLTIQQQLPLFNELPYPIRFDSSRDLYWSIQSQSPSNPSENGSHQQLPKNEKPQTKHDQRAKDRICVEFKGTKDYIFKIQCDRRQLPLFQQFLTDYQTYTQLPEEERFSEALFALRSARLIWRKDDDSRHSSKKKRTTDKQEDQLKPWNTHRLYLHCTVDRRRLTAEGTEQVREEKKREVIKKLKGRDRLEEAQLQELGLTKNQISDVKRKRSTLNRLKNYSPPPRPRVPLYQGQPHIVVGVSFSRHQPVAIAVVDVAKAEVLECQSAKELLNRGEAQYIWRNGQKEPLSKNGSERRHPNGGKLLIRKRKRVRFKPYRLVEQLHRRHQQHPPRRAEQQKQNCYTNNNSDSNLGLYVDRLIAAKIVELALKRKAGTIAIPQLEGIRESVESDIRAQAERLFPNEKERQKEYAKHYRASFHRWSYARLSECIRECAKREGIAVVESKQSSQGDLEQKAIAIALSSYNVKTS